MSFVFYNIVLKYYLRVNCYDAKSTQFTKFGLSRTQNWDLEIYIKFQVLSLDSQKKLYDNNFDKLYYQKIKILLKSW